MVRKNNFIAPYIDVWGLARFLRKKASREGRIREQRENHDCDVTWKPQTVPDHPSCAVALVMQVLTLLL